MNEAGIWDAVARQAALIPGIKAAYASGVGGQGSTVRYFPSDILDGPVALVVPAGGRTTNVPPGTRYEHTFDIELWMPLGNGSREAAVAAVTPLLTLLTAAFWTNTHLFGVADQAYVISWGGIEEGLLNDKPFLVRRVSVIARESSNVEPGIGPSS